MDVFFPSFSDRLSFIFLQLWFGFGFWLYFLDRLRRRWLWWRRRSHFFLNFWWFLFFFRETWLRLIGFLGCVGGVVVDGDYRNSLFAVFFVINNSGNWGIWGIGVYLDLFIGL